MPLTNGKPQPRLYAIALRLLGLAAVLVSAAYVVMFFTTAFLRMHFPYDLEWIEDQNLIETGRVLHHLPLYVAPSIHYVAYIYAPLYYIVSAFVARFTGLSFYTLRLVSTLSTAGIFCVIFVFVFEEFDRKSRGRFLGATVAVGFFACCYSNTGAFYDLARVDMLCIFAASLALLAGRRGYPVLAALLWVCAFQTKQALLPVAVIALCFEWQRPRRLLLGLGSFAIFSVASVTWFNHVDPIYYIRWIFFTGGGFPIVPRLAALFFAEDLCWMLGIAMLLIIAAVLITPPATWRSSRVNFYGFTGFALIAVSWFIRSHAGASNNAVIPAILWISIAAGVGFGRLYQAATEVPAEKANPLLAVLLCAPIAQMLMSVYTPATFVPTPAEVAARDSFIRQIHDLPGNVLVFEHPVYGILAGKESYAAGEASLSVMLSRTNTSGALIRQAYGDAVRQKLFSAIVVDDFLPQRGTKGWAPDDLMTLYPVKVSAAGYLERRFTPAPYWILLPCPTDPKSLRLQFPDSNIDLSHCPNQ